MIAALNAAAAGALDSLPAARRAPCESAGGEDVKTTAIIGLSFPELAKDIDKEHARASILSRVSALLGP